PRLSDIGRGVRVLWPGPLDGCPWAGLRPRSARRITASVGRVASGAAMGNRLESAFGQGSGDSLGIRIVLRPRTLERVLLQSLPEPGDHTLQCRRQYLRWTVSLSEYPGKGAGPFSVCLSTARGREFFALERYLELSGGATADTHSE